MKARQIAGCYRRDEAHDPELFAGQLALVLGDYTREIIEYASDPRSGVVTKHPMGLPQVPQIKEFLDDLVRHAERTQQYAKQPRFQRDRDPLPPPERATLFVSDVAPDFDKMWAKHVETGGKESRADTRVCHFDGQRHAGVWVPPIWWEKRHAVA